MALQDKSLSTQTPRDREATTNTSNSAVPVPAYQPKPFYAVPADDVTLQSCPMFLLSQRLLLFW